MMGIGYLSDEPKLVELSNTVVASFTLSYTEEVKSKDGEEPKRLIHYLDFKIWDTGAKYFCSRVKKGDYVYFEARPRQEKWVDKDTGKNRSRIVFRLDHFKIINGFRDE